MAQSFPSVVIIFFILFVGGAILGAFVILKTILQGLSNAICGIFKSTNSLFHFVVRPNAALNNFKKCARWNCQCQNPTHANFCRRCGKEF